MLKTNALLAILLCMALQVFSQSYSTPGGWKWKNPTPYGGSFRTVHMFDANHALAAGDFGIMLKTDDGGETWSQLANTPEYNFKKMVFSADNATGYMLTADSSILKSTDGGQSWQLQNKPSNTMKPVDINMVHDSVFLFMQSRTTNPAIISMPVNGTTWNTVANTSVYMQEMNYPLTWNADNTVSNLYTGEKKQVYTNGGSIVHLQIKPGSTSAFYLLIRGTSPAYRLWESSFTNNASYEKETYINQVSDSRLGGPFGVDIYGLKSFIAINENLIYLYGQYLVRLTDKMDKQEILGDPGGSVNELSFYDDQVAAGAADNARLLYTVNGGNLWSAVIQPTVRVNYIRNLGYFNGSLYATSMTKDSLYLLNSTDNGTSWKTLYAMGSEQFASGNYNGPFGLSGVPYYDSIWTDKFQVMENNDVYLSSKFSKEINGKGHTLLHLSYKGGSYTPEYLFPDSLLDYHFINSNKGYAVSTKAYLYKYENGSWARIGTQLALPSQYACIYFFDSQHGYVGGEQGKIFKTSNEGNTWQDISVAGVTINNIQFISADTGYVVAAKGTFFRTYNGDATSVTWIAKATNTKDDLYALHFYSGKVGYVVSSHGLMTTFDGGTNFTLVRAPFDPYVQSLNNVIYFSSRNYFDGWIQRTPSITMQDKTLKYAVYASGPDVLSYGTASGGGGTAIENTSATGNLSLLAYPNPATQQLGIALPMDATVMSVTVYNLLGQAAVAPWHRDGSVLQLDVSRIPAGLYIVKVQAGDKSGFVRFTKE